jgi:inorganic pyrophosphatase
VILMMSLVELDAFDLETELLNVIVDTPKGSRNKFSYDEKHGLFKLSGVLPVGAIFPFDFGFIPSTQGGDGDPLDVLLLLDESAFTGCLVPARLLGMIKAEQTEREGAKMRNDRLIAVAADSATHSGLKDLKDLNKALLEQIEHFFISYNAIKGKEFKPIGRFGAERAERVVRDGIKKFAKPTRSG